MPHPGATTRLHSGGATILLDGENVRTHSAAVLFLVVFLYCWVSAYPFENLQDPPANAAAVNQIAGFLLTLGLLAYAAANRLLSMLLRPRALILFLFAWLALTTAMSVDPLVGLRRLFFTGLLCVCASTLPVLPASREQFGRLLKLLVLILLGASYLGVVLMPDRAIHQVHDLYEPRLAGDWRGIFNHKNTAAPAMVVLCFISLYAMRTGRRAAWAAMAVLAIVFLWKAGGKTALGLFPVTLLLAFLVTRRPLLGAAALVATMAVIGTLTIGSALSPGIHEFLAGHGIDATFTARTDIWQIALEAAGRQPLSGRLRMGVIPTVGPFLLPRILPALREAYPALKLYLTEDRTERLVEQLKEGALDILLLALPYDIGDVETVCLAEDSFYFCCLPEHPLAQRNLVPVEALKGENLLLLEDGHCLRDHALAACRLEGARNSQGFRATSLHTLVQMVDNGLGVTLLPKLALDGRLLDGTRLVARPMDDAEAKREIGLVWRRGTARREEFQLLADFLKAQMAALST